MRKQRTREHIIDDLGMNHIERQVLYAGYTFYRYTNSDYGYDASMTTFNENGEIENLQMNIQLKSTDNIKRTSDKQFFVFDISKRDLELWCNSDIPVVLLLYDAQKEVAYYIDILEYFQKDGINLNKISKFVRLKFSQKDIWNPQIVIKLRHIKTNLRNAII
jgi:Domain of unknown function (DUF4365)